MCYEVNIWCVRESPDLCSVGMFVSDKMALNSIHVLLHRRLSVEALCFLIKLGGILRKMMGSYEPHSRQQMVS